MREAPAARYSERVSLERGLVVIFALPFGSGSISSWCHQDARPLSSTDPDPSSRCWATAPVFLDPSSALAMGSKKVYVVGTAAMSTWF